MMLTEFAAAYNNSQEDFREVRDDLVKTGRILEETNEELKIEKMRVAECERKIKKLTLQRDEFWGAVIDKEQARFKISLELEDALKKIKKQGSKLVVS